MEDIPQYVSLLFVLVTFTVFGFAVFGAYWALGRSRTALALFSSILIAWLLITGILSFGGYFYDFEAVPPLLFRFVGPIMIVLVVLLIWHRSRRSLMKIPITTLTYIHIVRVPVELCLWWLFLSGWLAQEMTFEGANFDILAGITAPFAGVFLVSKKINNRIAAIIWHFLSLGLVLNIVIRAVYYTPYFYDGTGEQLQNMAVFDFPFVWLPTFVVPMVIVSHITALLILFKRPD